jgi:hypothetical protein
MMQGMSVRERRIAAGVAALMVAAACGQQGDRDDSPFGATSPITLGATDAADDGSEAGTSADDADVPGSDSSGGAMTSDGSDDAIDPSCDDAIHNGMETGVDCGGFCPPCADGMGCDASSDCASSVCESGTCHAATCDDAIPNGIETDADCGGGDCPQCAVCLHCNADSDCAPGLCEDGLCGPTIEITSAIYAANCGAPTVVQTIFDQCNGKKTCDHVFNYTEDVGFDPAYGCMKDLSIEYTCTGGTTVKSFYESCAPCDPQNSPTAIHLELECDACIGVGQPPA